MSAAQQPWHVKWNHLKQKMKWNKKCSYNHKSVKGTKINVHTVTEQTHKVFDYSYCCLKDSDRISSMSGKIQAKQTLVSSEVSSRHQIPSYQTNTASKLNEYINKLTVPYFHSFCLSFHIPFFYNIFDQRLFCYYKKLFQPIHKKVIKIKKWLALNLPLTSLFSNAW